MAVPAIPSLTAASKAESAIRATSNNSFMTGDLIAGSSSKNNNFLLYGLIGVLFLMMLKKG